MALLSVAVSAQDFASRFMAEHQADSNLTCVTISPKMMEEIMKSDAEKDKEVLDMISNLKSMHQKCFCFFLIFRVLILVGDFFSKKMVFRIGVLPKMCVMKTKSPGQVKQQRN